MLASKIRKKKEIYIYICMSVYVCVYIHIHTYTYIYMGGGEQARYYSLQGIFYMHPPTDSIYHGLYTSHTALAGMRNCSMGD